MAADRADRADRAERRSDLGVAFMRALCIKQLYMLKPAVVLRRLSDQDLAKVYHEADPSTSDQTSRQDLTTRWVNDLPSNSDHAPAQRSITSGSSSSSSNYSDSSSSDSDSSSSVSDSSSSVSDSSSSDSDSSSSDSDSSSDSTSGRSSLSGSSSESSIYSARTVRRVPSERSQSSSRVDDCRRNISSSQHCRSPERGDINESLSSSAPKRINRGDFKSKSNDTSSDFSSASSDSGVITGQYRKSPKRNSPKSRERGSIASECRTGSVGSISRERRTSISSRISSRGNTSDTSSMTRKKRRIISFEEYERKKLRKSHQTDAPSGSVAAERIEEEFSSAPVTNPEDNNLPTNECDESIADPNLSENTSLTNSPVRKVKLVRGADGIFAPKSNTPIKPHTIRVASQSVDVSPTAKRRNINSDIYEELFPTVKQPRLSSTPDRAAGKENIDNGSNVEGSKVVRSPYESKLRSVPSKFNASRLVTVKRSLKVSSGLTEVDPSESVVADVVLKVTEPVEPRTIDVQGELNTNLVQSKEVLQERSVSPVFNAAKEEAARNSLKRERKRKAGEAPVKRKKVSMEDLFGRSDEEDACESIKFGEISEDRSVVESNGDEVSSKAVKEEHFDSDTIVKISSEILKTIPKVQSSNMVVKPMVIIPRVETPRPTTPISDSNEQVIEPTLPVGSLQKLSETLLGIVSISPEVVNEPLPILSVHSSFTRVEKTLPITKVKHGSTEASHSREAGCSSSRRKEVESAKRPNCSNPVKPVSSPKSVIKLPKSSPIVDLCCEEAAVPETAIDDTIVDLDTMPSHFQLNVSTFNSLDMSYRGDSSAEKPVNIMKETKPPVAREELIKPISKEVGTVTLADALNWLRNCAESEGKYVDGSDANQPEYLSLSLNVDSPHPRRLDIEGDDDDSVSSAVTEVFVKEMPVDGVGDVYDFIDLECEDSVDISPIENVASPPVGTLTGIDMNERLSETIDHVSIAPVVSKKTLDNETVQTSTSDVEGLPVVSKETLNGEIVQPSTSTLLADRTQAEPQTLVGAAPSEQRKVGSIRVKNLASMVKSVVIGDDEKAAATLMAVCEDVVRIKYLQYVVQLRNVALNASVVFREQFKRFLVLLMAKNEELDTVVLKIRENEQFRNSVFSKFRILATMRGFSFQKYVDVMMYQLISYSHVARTIAHLLTKIQVNAQRNIIEISLKAPFNSSPSNDNAPQLAENPQRQVPVQQDHVQSQSNQHVALNSQRSARPIATKDTPVAASSGLQQTNYHRTSLPEYQQPGARFDNSHQRTNHASMPDNLRDTTIPIRRTALEPSSHAPPSNASRAAPPEITRNVMQEHLSTQNIQHTNTTPLVTSQTNTISQNHYSAPSVPLLSASVPKSVNVSPFYNNMNNDRVSCPQYDPSPQTIRYTWHQYLNTPSKKSRTNIPISSDTAYISLPQNNHINSGSNSLLYTVPISNPVDQSTTSLMYPPTQNTSSSQTNRVLSTQNNISSAVQRNPVLSNNQYGNSVPSATNQVYPAVSNNRCIIASAPTLYSHLFSSDSHMIVENQVPTRYVSAPRSNRIPTTVSQMSAQYNSGPQNNHFPTTRVVNTNSALQSSSTSNNQYVNTFPPNQMYMANSQSNCSVSAIAPVSGSINQVPLNSFHDTTNQAHTTHSQTNFSVPAMAPVSLATNQIPSNSSQNMSFAQTNLLSSTQNIISNNLSQNSVSSNNHCRNSTNFPVYPTRDSIPNSLPEPTRLMKPSPAYTSISSNLNPNVPINSSSCSETHQHMPKLVPIPGQSKFIRPVFEDLQSNTGLPVASSQNCQATLNISARLHLAPGSSRRGSSTQWDPAGKFYHRSSLQTPVAVLPNAAPASQVGAQSNLPQDVGTNEETSLTAEFLRDLEGFCMQMSDDLAKSGGTSDGSCNDIHRNNCMSTNENRLGRERTEAGNFPIDRPSASGSSTARGITGSLSASPNSSNDSSARSSHHLGSGSSEHQNLADGDGIQGLNSLVNEVTASSSLNGDSNSSQNCSNNSSFNSSTQQTTTATVLSNLEAESSGVDNLIQKNEEPLSLSDETTLSRLPASTNVCHLLPLVEETASSERSQSLSVGKDLGKMNVPSDETTESSIDSIVIMSSRNQSEMSEKDNFSLLKTALSVGDIPCRGVIDESLQITDGKPNKTSAPVVKIKDSYAGSKLGTYSVSRFPLMACRLHAMRKSTEEREKKRKAVERRRLPVRESSLARQRHDQDGDQIETDLDSDEDDDDRKLVIDMHYDSDSGASDLSCRSFD